MRCDALYLPIAECHGFQHSTHNRHRSRNHTHGNLHVNAFKLQLQPQLRAHTLPSGWRSSPSTPARLVRGSHRGGPEALRTIVSCEAIE